MMLLLNIKKIKNKEIKNPVELEVKYKDVLDKTTTSYNYQIRCSYINSENNKIYYFVSKKVNFNPEEYIKENNIQSFKLIYEKDNINNYSLDISGVENYFKGLIRKEAKEGDKINE